MPPTQPTPGIANQIRFELEVLAPLDRRVVSNTPVMMSNEETVELPSGRKERRRRWKFAETPVMSTYLLALVRGRGKPAREAFGANTHERTTHTHGPPSGALNRSVAFLVFMPAKTVYGMSFSMVSRLPR